MNTLIYIHDPMCSWCWAFASGWRRIQAELPDNVGVQVLLGGLAPDSDVPMPQDMQQFLSETWRLIEQSVPGTRFNHDFWRDCQPRRSTWPACRAVLTAEILRDGAGTEMSTAIQHAYYLEAKNPADTEVLVSLAESIGLDSSAFAALINSEENRERHTRQMAHAQELGVNSYPTLLLQTPAQLQCLPIDYNDPQVTLTAIGAAIHSA